MASMANSASSQVENLCYFRPLPLLELLPAEQTNTRLSTQYFFSTDGHADRL
jgi:hypothetical protein